MAIVRCPSSRSRVFSPARILAQVLATQENHRRCGLRSLWTAFDQGMMRRVEAMRARRKREEFCRETARIALGRRIEDRVRQDPLRMFHSDLVRSTTCASSRIAHESLSCTSWISHSEALPPFDAYVSTIDRTDVVVGILVTSRTTQSRRTITSRFVAFPPWCGEGWGMDST